MARLQVAVVADRHPFWQRLRIQLEHADLAIVEASAQVTVMPAVRSSIWAGSGPVVLVGTSAGPGGPGRAVVASDPLALGSQAVRHLRSLGVRQIAVRGLPLPIFRGLSITACALGLALVEDTSAQALVIGDAQPVDPAGRPVVAIHHEDLLLPPTGDMAVFGPDPIGMADAVVAVCHRLAVDPAADLPRRLVPPASTPAFTTAAQASDANRLAIAIAWIEQHYARNLAVEEVADAVGISSRHLQRLCAEHLGRSPLAEIHRIRVERARALLLDSDLRIADIAQAVGFAEADRLTAAFRRFAGCTPGQLRRARGGS